MTLFDRNQRNIFVFNKYARPKILRRGKQNYQNIYNSYFLPGFYKENCPCEPIALKTFYKFIERYIDPDDLIRAQEGRVALRYKTIAKTGKFVSEGYGVRVEVDGYHEPIALLDPKTFKPIGVRPIHYLAHESHVGIYVSWITDYVSGSENSSHVIELYKGMMFPKPDFQEIFGSKHPHIFYCKPFNIYHDGGTAFKAETVFDFIALANTTSGQAKTQYGQGKSFVESGISSIKEKLTFELPGHYNDRQDKYIDTTHYSKFAVLTTLEHHVLFNRHMNDEQNYGYDKRRKIIRAEQWIREAAFKPPALPDKPEDLLNFSGLKDNKTIQVAVGIQFHVRNKTYTFNSEQLQKLLRRLVHKKLSNKVDFHRSEFFPKEIKVVNPITDELLIVPIVEADENSIIPFVGNGEFYSEYAKLQTIERLSRLTNEQIIKEAEARDRAIKKYKKQKKLALADDAKSLEEVMKDDFAKFKKAMENSSATNVEIAPPMKSESIFPHADDDTPTSSEDLQESPDDHPTNEEWDDNVDFGGSE